MKKKEILHYLEGLKFKLIVWIYGDWSGEVGDFMLGLNSCKKDTKIQQKQKNIIWLHKPFSFFCLG